MSGGIEIVRVLRTPAARRWAAFDYLGRACVCINSDLAPEEQRLVLASRT